MIYTGKATVAGFAGTVSWSGAGTFYKNTGELTTERKQDILFDDNNEPKGTITPSHGLQRFKFQFHIATASTATAATALAEPTHPATVTLSGFTLAGVNHARWLVVPGSWRLAFSKDGIATYDLEIICSTDSGVNLATTIS